MAGLSKSKYVKYCQCPKALWLQVNKPEEAEVDSSVEARFAAGNEVGNLAKSRYAGGYDVTTENGAKLDLSAMIAKTQQCIADGVDTIYEAAFSCKSNDCVHYCAVDILRKTPNGWAIYEVKSSTSHQGDEENNPDKLMKYATDIAYQKWVLEQCGVKVDGTYLVTLNSDYVRYGELNLQQLFNALDLSKLVANESAKLSVNIPQACKILQQQDEPSDKIGLHCHAPYKCAFWDYCTKQQGLDLKNNKATVFDLYRLSMKKKFEHFYNDTITFEDLRSQKLNPIQQMQVECTLNNSSSINKKGINEFLDKVTYPLYFLDFESMQPTVPQYDGSRPYMQICFQYSLHYIEHEGGELKHTAFLAQSDGSDPRRALAEQLCRDIPRDVCIMAYNDPFEKTRIKEMAEIYPDLSVHLNDIRNNIIDLLLPFRNGHYYLPQMGGSFSIKVVLPALFPDDPALDYHNLDEQVQNGGDAMTIFPQIAKMTPEKAKSARNALLEYCKLDTLAMVKIWQKLIETVNIKILENSTMFHFSLGSKELFHSNFLHWLHIINKNEFIKLMRKFADHENDQFWWEKEYYKEDGKIYEVRRESQNFDLSIWINLNSKKWVPVLVLENKMKSLARQSQLNEYVQKAYEKWGKTKLKDYKENPPITFILLSLVEDQSYDAKYECETDIKTNEKIEFSSKWINKTYKDLNENIKSFIKNDNSLNDKIIEDYQSFIVAMYNLGKSWKVNDDTPWKNVLPQENLKKLRINDAHQKFCYSQIEQMLNKKLKEKLNGKQYETSSSFSNGSGLVDASIKVDDELKFLVQVQGDNYRRAIVSKNGDALKKAEENNKKLWCNFFIFNDNFNLNKDYFNNKKDDIISNGNKRAQGEGASKEKFRFFKTEFAYQCVAIDNETKIKTIVEAIVNDIMDMLNLISDSQNNKQSSMILPTYLQQDLDTSKTNDYIN